MNGLKAIALALLSVTAFSQANELTAKPYTQKSIPVGSAVSRQIDRLIEPQMRADLFSGVILIQRGDHVLFQHAYGFASWELRVPNNNHTRFGIASITKPMTEALVWALVQEHRLDLQAPVEKYIPGFPRGPSGGEPTIEELLKHTAGVPHRVTTVAEEMQPLHPADIVERVKAPGLLFEPGSRELYSSAGYTSLARIIEVIEGRPFEESLAEDVFRAAQMSSATSETGQRLMPERALPYILGAGKDGAVVEAAPYKDLSFLAGAGSVYATPGDLVAFIRKVRGGAFGEQLQNWAKAGDQDKWRGWYGRTNGYEASVDLLPSQNLILVILSNLQSAANWQLRQRIRGLMLGHSVLPIPLPPARVTNFEPASDVVGLYGDPSDPVQVALHEGELYRDANQIYPIAGNSYYIPVSGFTMKFRRQNMDVDSIVTIYDDDRERVLQRLAAQ